MPEYERVLVTGGAGFIGSHLVDRLLKEGFDVIVLDNLSSGHVRNIKHHIGKRGFQFIKGDIRNRELVNKLVKEIDVIFHLAAIVSVPQSVRNPTLVNEVNVSGTLNLLEAARKSKVKRFIFASSCAVYGNPQSLPIKEESPLRPISPYGASKLAAETYVQVFHKVYGLKTVCLRYFNVYGPRQSEGRYSSVISRFLRALREDRPLKIYGDGKQTRDFVHVHDVVEANVLALKERKAVGECFNIATGSPITIEDLAKKFMAVFGKKTKIAYLKPRRGDIRHSYADISKAVEKLGYKPKISLENGLVTIIKQ